MGGSRFTVRTDHSTPRWILNLFEATGKLTRFLPQLSKYYFTVIHSPGVKLQQADALPQLQTDGLENSPVDDDIPVIASEQIVPVSPNETEGDYLAFSLCTDKVHKLSATPNCLGRVKDNQPKRAVVLTRIH